MRHGSLPGMMQQVDLELRVGSWATDTDFTVLRVLVVLVSREGEKAECWSTAMRARAAQSRLC